MLCFNLLVALYHIQFILSGNKFQSRVVYIDMICQDVNVIRSALALSATANFVVYAELT